MHGKERECDKVVDNKMVTGTVDKANEDVICKVDNTVHTRKRSDATNAKEKASLDKS